MTVFRFWPTDAGVAAFDVAELAAELVAASSDATIERVDFGRVRLLTPAQSVTTRSDLLTIIQAHTGSPLTLPRSKAKKMAEVSMRTDELLELGFEHPALSGIFFSLSATAFLRMEACHTARATIFYPLVVEVLDKSTTVSFADSAAVGAWYLDGVDILRARVDSGVSIDNQIRAAVDIAAVDAIADNR